MSTAPRCGRHRPPPRRAVCTSARRPAEPETRGPCARRARLPRGLAAPAGVPCFRQRRSPRAALGPRHRRRAPPRRARPRQGRVRRRVGLVRRLGIPRRAVVSSDRRRDALHERPAALECARVARPSSVSVDRKRLSRSGSRSISSMAGSIAIWIVATSKDMERSGKGRWGCAFSRHLGSRQEFSVRLRDTRQETREHSASRAAARTRAMPPPRAILTRPPRRASQWGDSYHLTQSQFKPTTSTTRTHATP